jgi:hypothetical protein
VEKNKIKNRLKTIFKLSRHCKIESLVGVCRKKAVAKVVRVVSCTF